MGLRVVSYFLMAGFGVFGAGLAWLFWPLPDARFDWQGAVQSYVESDRCLRVPLVLATVASVEPEALIAFLEGRSISEICSVSPDIEIMPIFEGGYTASTDDELAQALLDSQFAEANLRRAPLGFGPAFDGLVWNRSLRRIAGLGWLGWPEIVLTMRCEYPLLWTRQAAWYWQRLLSGTFRGDGWELPGWERRKAWCHRYANNQLHVLQSSIGELPSFDTDEGTAQRYLLTQYETWAIQWMPHEDIIRLNDQPPKAQP